MNKISKEIYSTLKNMPKEFSTHEFILKFSQTYQHAYIQALYNEIGFAQPFKSLHLKLGKFLRSAPNSVEMLQSDYKDKDIFGQVSKNALWRKRP